MKNLIKAISGISLITSLALSKDIDYYSQLRAGYITLDNKENSDFDTEAFAIGGRIGVKTDITSNFSFNAELYTVQDLGVQNDDLNKVNGDFFDKNLEGFSLLTQAYVSMKFENTEIKIGRQSIDTPHADSDDIRMMPNYFSGYFLTNGSIENLTLMLGLIDKMAGWENEVDPSKFVNVEKSLGAQEKTDGIYLISALYEEETFSIGSWYYDIDEIADVLYLEASYTLKTSFADITASLQYDRAKERGKKVLGEIDSGTFGIGLETAFKENFSLNIAYNKETQDKSFGSLGGGAFFTSMEDQTIDAIENKGESWTVGISKELDKISLETIYGEFKAEDKNLYNTSELDIIANYSPTDKFSLTVAYAVIDDKTENNEDYSQLRIIGNYNF